MRRFCGNSASSLANTILSILHPVTTVLEEFDERRQKRDADTQQHAELDDQFLLQFLHVVSQGKFQFLQRLSVGGLVLLKLVF